jgi:hypothetical protein
VTVVGQCSAIDSALGQNAIRAFVGNCLPGSFYGGRLGEPPPVFVQLEADASAALCSYEEGSVGFQLFDHIQQSARRELSSTEFRMAQDIAGLEEGADDDWS